MTKIPCQHSDAYFIDLRKPQQFSLISKSIAAKADFISKYHRFGDMAAVKLVI